MEAPTHSIPMAPALLAVLFWNVLWATYESVPDPNR